MMLCDSAETDQAGKLNIRGAGWSVVSSPTLPSAVAMKIEVPWSLRGKPMHLDLELVDADGRKVGSATAEHDGVTSSLAQPGVPLDSTLVVPVPALNLRPGRYVWQLRINEEDPEGGHLGFTVRQ
ncbi:DUF6941 family protein [Streptomyces sp. NBC_01216]|uniref:DUF6941 family protein n=1 Tax=Streptomyces sp. NBC_01216 TaxID=2903778 RepID=UPI003FA3BE4A